MAAALDWEPWARLAGPDAGRALLHAARAVGAAAAVLHGPALARLVVTRALAGSVDA